jgi:hypothetical protein
MQILIGARILIGAQIFISAVDIGGKKITKELKFHGNCWIVQILCFVIMNQEKNLKFFMINKPCKFH